MKVRFESSLIFEPDRYVSTAGFGKHGRRRFRVSRSSWHSEEGQLTLRPRAENRPSRHHTANVRQMRWAGCGLERFEPVHIRTDAFRPQPLQQGKWYRSAAPVSLLESWSLSLLCNHQFLSHPETPRVRASGALSEGLSTPSPKLRMAR